MKIVVGWRIICCDCGINTDLHAAFNEEDSEDQAEEKAMIICRGCIDERSKGQ